MMNAEQPERYELRNRYVFEGTLVMQTALHIGGGRITLSSSDSPIVMTPDQKPFIPGSSFKGAFRSTIEKIVPGLPENFSTCALIGIDEDEEKETGREAKEGGSHRCSTQRQKEFADKRRKEPGEAKKFAQEALNGLCDTCRLFGSPYAAARVDINDLYISSQEWGDVIQIRDGVAIDRDTEKAKDRLKYDFEVVPASAAFGLRIVLENATRKDLQLTCVGLSEFVHGFGVIGGKRSRGLGVCRLENLQVKVLELKPPWLQEEPPKEGRPVKDLSAEERLRRLKNYLLHKQFSDEIDGKNFLKKHIETIFPE
jgi:CRISPR-associated RAMP protein (TIGR02581 family)